MNAEPVRLSVPEIVQNKLHAVRRAGNRAANPRPSLLGEHLSC
jgi:type I restriction enzyme R subunit